MFVDDSLWPTRSARTLEELARMHETFCNFHKVFIHKTKSEYMTVNGKGVQVRWRPTGEGQGEGAPKAGATAAGANNTTTRRGGRECDGGEPAQAASARGFDDEGEGLQQGGDEAGRKGGGGQEGQQGSARGSPDGGRQQQEPFKTRRGKVEKGTQSNLRGPRDTGNDTSGRARKQGGMQEGGEASR